MKRSWTSCHLEIVHGAIVLANMNYRSQAIREFNCQVSIETKNMHNIKSQVTMTTVSGQSQPTDTEPFPLRTYRIEFIQIWMSNMVRYVWTYFVKCAHAFGAICSIVFAGVFFSAVFFGWWWNCNRWIWSFDTIFSCLQNALFAIRVHDWVNGVDSTHTTDSCIWKWSVFISINIEPIYLQCCFVKNIQTDSLPSSVSLHVCGRCIQMSPAKF